jgi:hypothetical protein
MCRHLVKILSSGHIHATLRHRLNNLCELGKVKLHQNLKKKNLF